MSSNNNNMISLNHKIPYLFFISLLVAGCQSKLPDSNSETLFDKIDADYSGLDFSNDLIETSEHNHIVDDEFITGGGVGVGDINNDGLLDLFFSGNQVGDKLYLNQGELRFKDITKSAGILLDGKWSTGVSFMDINSDGNMDIYVCRNVWLNHEESKNLLYINNGDLTFTESASEYNIADKGFSVQASFFDFDKDGMLDFYLVNQPPSIGSKDGGKIREADYMNLATTDKLYKRFSEKMYHDAGPYAGTRNFAYGLSATVGDLDNDHWQDIYVANDFDQPDHIYFNKQNGQYLDLVNSSVKHISNFSMGTDIADYDNDGLLDIMVLDMVAEDHKRIKTFMGGMNPESFWETVNKGRHYQYMFNTLQRNNGNGTFSELGHLAGVSNTDWSWASLLADFDNDGFKDLFVTNGVKRNMRHSDLTNQQGAILDSLEIVASKEGKTFADYIDLMHFVKMAPIDKLPNYIFKNNGDLTFTKKIEEWGFSELTLSNGASYADLDNDGDLDLVVNNVDDKVGLYRNTAVEKGLGNYLRVELNCKNFSHKNGTKIRLYQSERLLQIVEITGARGYMSQSEDIAHFGLGDVEMVDRVEVEWADGQFSVIKNVTANQRILVEKERLNTTPPEREEKLDPIFTDITKKVGLNFRHKENSHDDFEKEVLLPHKMSEFGPKLAVGDVNGDGLEDFYIGGSVGESGAIFIQSSDGKFERRDSQALEMDKGHEDAGAVFFDADKDGDLDLFVSSGGNEFEKGSIQLKDRLYINNGKGRLSKSSLPDYRISSGDVLPNDFDNDGDLDLYIAGRMMPISYPQAASSVLLENTNGKFEISDQSENVENIGMVTQGEWGDLDGNGWDDLVLVGEWMPITIFMNNNGTLTLQENPAFEKSNGWYYSVGLEDMDDDGDLDMVVGNLGLNYKYRASEEEPFEVYSDDFDNNGSKDIVLSYYEHGNRFPIRGRSCSSQQIPDIAMKFETYEAFGDADLVDIYGTDLESALKLEAFTFASYYIENLGEGGFDMKQLPMLAQTSSINNIVLRDFDKDGLKDILISGNLYQSEIETPRNDAGLGLFMKGNGNGDFIPLSIKESGFFAPHDAKSMELIDVKGTPHLLIGNNQYWLQLIKNQ